MIVVMLVVMMMTDDDDEACSTTKFDFVAGGVGVGDRGVGWWGGFN